MLLKQFNDGKVAKKGKVAAGDNICAAVLYVTCKQEPGTVSFRRKDVANVLGITSEQIKKSCNVSDEATALWTCLCGEGYIVVYCILLSRGFVFFCILAFLQKRCDAFGELAPQRSDSRTTLFR